MTGRAFLRSSALVTLALVALAQPSAAQPSAAQPSAAQPAGGAGGPPNALQGFSVNRDKPIRITSTTLEVRDKEKRATFIGNVLVAQGDTTMKSKTLDVFYDQEGDDPNGKATSGTGAAGPMAESQQIRRLEAKGGVVVAQKDQTATGETGIFDMRGNTVTLIGNVVITQGPQVIRGERLTVDLTSGVSRVDGGTGGVQGLFMPNQARAKANEKSAADKAAADGKQTDRQGDRPDNTAADNSDGRKDSRSGKSAPGHPMKLN